MCTYQVYLNSADEGYPVIGEFSSHERALQWANAKADEFFPRGELLIQKKEVEFK